MKKGNHESRRLAWLVVAVVIGVSVFVAIGSGGVAAQSNDTAPETSGEFLDAFLDLQGSEAFREYTEFETVRSVGVAESQVGSFTEADRQRMDAVYRSLSAFDLAYREMEAGNYSRGLDEAERAETAVDDLQSQNAKYAPLAQLALDRFFRDRAEELLSKAEDADKTADQVRFLSLTARAYQLAGASGKFTEVSNRQEEQRRELEEDRTVINDTTGDAEAFLDGCTDCGTPREAITALGPSVFPRYATAFVLDTRLGSSETLTNEHGLDDQRERIQALNGDIDEIQRSLALASAALIIAFLFVLAPLIAVVTLRVTAWHQDSFRAGIGKSVLAEEVADA